MTIYYLLFVFLLVLSLLELSNVKIIKIARIFTVIILLAISGFRYEVGNDYNNYVLMFNNVEYFSYIEPGFRGLIWLVKTLGLNVQALFLVSAILAIVPLAYVVNKYCSRHFFTAISLYVMTYIYFEGMNSVRQAISMTILFFAFCEYFEKRKILYFLLFSILASLFHLSSILIAFSGWVIVWYSGSDLKIKNFFIALIISFVAGYYINSFAGQIEFVASIIGYSESKYFDEIEQRGVNTGIYHFVLNFYAIGFMLYAYIKRSLLKDFEKNTFKLFFTSIIVYNFFFNFYIGLRFYWYFFLFIILVIPIILSHIDKSIRTLTFLLMVSIFVAYSYLSLNKIYYSNYHYTFELIK